MKNDTFFVTNIVVIPEFSSKIVGVRKEKNGQGWRDIYITENNNEIWKGSLKNKSVLIWCGGCNLFHKKMFGSISTILKNIKYRCKRCSMIGKNNPFYGKHHSEESKFKMRNSAPNRRGENNSFYGKHHSIKSIEKALITRNADLNKWNRWRTNISNAVVKQHLLGNCIGYGRGHEYGWFDSKQQNSKIFYRSSYERIFLEKCETNKNCTSFKSCSFAIQYKDESGFIRNYLPDFILNEFIIIEIKPTAMLFGRNLLKIKAGKKYCKTHNMKFMLITERELDNEIQIGSN